MNIYVSRYALLLLLVFGVTAVDAEPIVPSYDRLQKKKRIKNFHAGRLLVEELNCVACHDARDIACSPKQAPVLSEVSGRAKADYLRKFIADPQATKPGTTMPSLFHATANDLRDEQVEALVHFLYSIGPGEPPQAYARYGAIRRGKELFHSVGCIGCHNPEGKELAGSVPHGDLVAKYTLASLTNFLRDPHAVRPSGRMPSLNLTSSEASDIASYLLPHVPEKAGIEFDYYEIATERVPDFDKLKPKVSGVATEFDINKHSEEDDRFALRYRGEFEADETGKYTFQLGSDDGSMLWIDGEVVVNNDGVHGMNRERKRIELEAGRHSVVVGYFEKDGGEELEVLYSGPGFKNERLDLAMVAAAPEVQLEDLSFDVAEALAAKGKQLFGSLGCASCHDAGQEITSQLKAPALASLDGTKGCLADSLENGARYDLSDNQKAALRKLASEGPAKLTKKRRVQHTMLQFNCVACHQRAKLGGVDADRTEYFTTTQPEMGMEGSLPPHLDGTGAKLTREWLDNILAKGAKDRPYMKTRMPKFGTNNVGHLGHQFEQLDHVDPMPRVELAASEAKRAGHKMVGAKGFGCIKCHTFGKHKATGVQSIDMTIMGQRLREDWFKSYVRNPQVYRRGTRMPSAWPETGPSLLKEILDADSDKQIAAVWRYLQDGIRAKTPFGLSTSSKELIPIEEAILYRNFIKGAGSRAIGVGYPESVHLAFDANDLRIALIWQGAYMDASRHWNGRGQGYQPPAGDKVQSLVEGVSIATLDRNGAQWPTESVRGAGHRFRGYRLSTDQRPTFMYEIGGLEITDFPNPVENETDVSLTRTLTISGETSPNTYLRLAVGTVSKKGDSFDVGGGLLIKVDGDAMVREIDGRQELLVPLSDSANERTIKLEYIW